MVKHKCHSLIIGGTGQFGITLRNQLNKKNKKVVITSRFKKSELIRKNYQIVQLNIYNKSKISQIIKRFTPKYIFYFASDKNKFIKR